MGRALADRFDVARRVFEEIDDRLGMRLSTLCFEGPADVLALTEHAQPAILACSLAAYRAVREATGVEPVAMAGHSLGEWSALVAAGSLDVAEAAEAVQERGRLMQSAVEVGAGAMAVIMGLAVDVVADLCCEHAEAEVVSPANLNGAGQVVIAGHTAAVERVMTAARAQRAKVQSLAVSAPFHCSLMEPARRGLEPTIAALSLRPLRVPVVTSVEARWVDDPDDARRLLVSQVTAPVGWEACVQALLVEAPTLMLECGPGRTLCGLMRRTASDLPCVPVGDPDGVERAVEALT